MPETYKADIPALAGKKFSYTDYDYDGLVAACEQVARQVIEREGGNVVGEGTDRQIVLPVQTPAPCGTLEQLSDFKPDDLAQWGKEFDARRKQFDGSH
jgi:hypothetical protein